VAYVITKPCIGVKDTACVVVCPCDCIRPTKDDAAFASADQLFIDPNHCIDCDICANECPVKAIFPEGDVPAEYTDFIAKNADYFKQVQE